MILQAALDAFLDSLSPTDKLCIVRNPKWGQLVEAMRATVADLHATRAALLGSKRVEVVR
jgi:hypothetical protein